MYEIHLTSFAAADLAIRRIAVSEARTGQVLSVLDSEALRQVLRPVASPKQPDDGTLRPGMSAVVYVELELGADRELPHELRHSIEYDAAQVRQAIEVGPNKLSERQPLVLGRPLRGGPWAAVYDPQLDRGHRRVFYAVDGAARIPGRFAIDWFKLNAQGETFSGARADPGDWLSYGADVLAVADGVIASVRDTVAERNDRPVAALRDLRDGSGNFVALGLPEGQFAFYEHLKPGSVRVKEGDRVRRGDVIAAVGNTGDTSGPHLHFHVADANSTLGAEGLPFVLESFAVLGRYESIRAVFQGEPWPASHPASIVRKELPASNVVVSFQP